MEIVPRSTAGIDAYQRRLTTLTGSALQGLGRDFTVLKGFDPVQALSLATPRKSGSLLAKVHHLVQRVPSQNMALQSIARAYKGFTIQSSP